jgi:hypothetical protein
MAFFRLADLYLSSALAATNDLGPDAPPSPTLTATPAPPKIEQLVAYLDTGTAPKPPVGTINSSNSSDLDTSPSSLVAPPVTPLEASPAATPVVPLESPLATLNTQETSPPIPTSQASGGIPSLRSLILAERGLLLAEMSLLAKNDRDFLLQAAALNFDLAERDSPGSSRYSKARWAAWTESPENLALYLSHTVAEQYNLLWPSLSEARLEPAFRDLIDERWFKTAWFGYSR